MSAHAAFGTDSWQTLGPVLIAQGAPLSCFLLLILVLFQSLGDRNGYSIMLVQYASKHYTTPSFE